MLDAGRFVRGLRARGFGVLSGVPCSFLTPLINTTLASNEASYVGATNEGDAVAVACGASLGGLHGVAMMQNSGLGNAVSPLTSLAATFRIPVMVVVTWRGRPGGERDEPQHGLMGRITPGLLDLMEIPWEEVPSDEADLPAALDRARETVEGGSSFAFVVRKGSFTGTALPPAAEPAGERAGPVALTSLSGPLDQDAVLGTVREATDRGEAVLTTTGFTGRALYAIEDRPSQFYMVGSMGCLSSLALGVALARPRHRVIAVDGDGALLMRLGALATIGLERPANLVHILLDNGVHDSTGAQATLSGSADLADVARACRYRRVVDVRDLSQLRSEIRSREPGPALLHVHTRPRSNRKLPRPTITPPEVAARFRGWLEATDPAGDAVQKGSQRAG